MLKIWLKHKIYEYCINLIFDNIRLNFDHKTQKALEWFRLNKKSRELGTESTEIMKAHSEIMLNALVGEDERKASLDKYSVIMDKYMFYSKKAMEIMQNINS